jgi:hypothetical protein
MEGAKIDAKTYCGLYVHGKAIPVQAGTGPYGSRKSRIPNTNTIGT